MLIHAVSTPVFYSETSTIQTVIFFFKKSVNMFPVHPFKVKFFFYL